jgi:hypothetical protein
LRLDAVRTVVAQLHAVKGVRRRDVKFEQQLAGLRLARRRLRGVPKQRAFVVGCAY